MVAVVSFGVHVPSAPAQLPGVPDPCDLPGPSLVCDAVGDVAGGVAGAAGDFVMRGVTVWVTNAAVWVTGKVGDLIDATASPDVRADWFVSQYRSMLAAAGVLALPMLLLAVIQALMRQDAWILIRSAFGYLPMAFVLAGAAVVGTDLLVSITDDLSAMVAHGLGGSSDNLLKSVGQAYRTAIEDDSADVVPLFGVFLGAIILAIGAFVLWLEMVIRDAAIYIALFFMPLTFIAMIWPATSRYARRPVEFLIAVILAKFVIVAILSLASAAITNAGAGADEGQLFERMIAGAALLVLAAWSPFALLRLLPMMEIAAVSMMTQRSSMSGAASSAGFQTPATYMRQAMDRHSRASPFQASPAAAGTIYSRPDQSANRSSQMSDGTTRVDSRTVRESRSGASSGAPSGMIQAPPRPSTSTKRTSSRDEASPTSSPPAPPRRSPPPEQPRDRPPPDEER